MGLKYVFSLNFRVQPLFIAAGFFPNLTEAIFLTLSYPQDYLSFGQTLPISVNMYYRDSSLRSLKRSSTYLPLLQIQRAGSLSDPPGDHQRFPVRRKTNVFARKTGSPGYLDPKYANHFSFVFRYGIFE